MNKALVIILGAIFVLVLMVLVSSFVVMISLNYPEISAKSDKSDIGYKYLNAMESNGNCNNVDSSVPCFKYEEFDQQRTGGVDYVPTQIRKEPCQEPPKKCKLCYPGLEQVKSEGHVDDLQQVRINC